MNLVHSSDSRILGTLVVLGVGCVLALALIPRLASAAAVSVTSITATSTNVYTNTGFATTSRVTAADTVHYQLNLGGTPLIPPQINIFNMGSTTMSGFGTHWFYATTTPSTAWTEGPITFKLGVGGDAGDATTTITQSSITTNVTYDNTAPTLNSVSWTDVDGSTNISGTDTLTFTFSETMATTSLTGADLNTVLALSGGHTFSTTTAPTWNTAGTVLTVTLGAATTVATGDTVKPTSAVKDSVGIADATVSALAITDNVAPNNPTGLSDTTYHGQASITLASTGSSSIYYTTDGTTPSCSAGTLYSGTFTFTSSTAMTVKAIGCDSVNNASSVVSAIYTRQTGGNGGGSSSSSSSSAPSTTSAPTTTTTPTQGCAPGNLFSTTSGMPCGTTTTTTTTTLPSTTPRSFVSNLTAGSFGDAVRALQEFLNTHGYVIAASGPGSPGNETSTFGRLTRTALAKYQKVKGITPAVGYFGPKTRAAVNADE